MILRTMLIVLLLAVAAKGEDVFGVAIKSNGFTKTHSDTVGAAVSNILHDTSWINFLTLPRARHTPSQQYFYMLWADQRQMLNVSTNGVLSVKAQVDAWLDGQGALKAMITTYAGTNTSWEAIEAAEGYER